MFTISLILYFYLFVYQLTIVYCFIPEQCGYNLTKGIPICCPVSEDTSEVCGGPKRGECVRIWTPKEKIPSVFLIDDRIDWPTRYFTYFCQCKHNYFGVACDECWFGWTGKHCNKRTIKIRRDIRTFSDRELHIFKTVYVLSQNWPSGYLLIDETHNWYVDPLRKPKLMTASVAHFTTYLHQYASRSTLYKNVKDCEDFGILNFNHDGVVFPVWHRYFILFWERLYGKIAYAVFGITNYAAPYWDWLGKTHCDVCIDKYIGSPGVRDETGLHISMGSPFYNLTEYCYEQFKDKLCSGCLESKVRHTITREFVATEFPDRRDLDFILNLKKYFTPGDRAINKCISFHMGLEGYCGRPGSNTKYRWFHNKVHVMIEGSMCCTATSTNDPLFILHHNFVDKVFECWLRKHNPSIDDYPEKHVRLDIHEIHFHLE
ncbi:unnamed protein product [Heterobilharzia americana]|nr:unnamed protein product [Heterobilharzia americana]